METSSSLCEDPVLARGTDSGALEPTEKRARAVSAPVEQLRKSGCLRANDPGVKAMPDHDQ